MHPTPIRLKESGIKKKVRLIRVSGHKNLLFQDRMLASCFCLKDSLTTQPNNIKLMINPGNPLPRLCIW